MNSRDYKVFRPGNCYHVYNRGNNKDPIFFDLQDYENFLKRLRILLNVSKGVFDNFDKSKKRIRLTPFAQGSFSVLSYCLMTNHFHLLIEQNTEASITALIQRLTTSYVKYINKKYNRIGNLFQDHFKAKLVDSDSYLKYLSAYIHNNPGTPLAYSYSSLKDYLGLRQDNLCMKNKILETFSSVDEYKKFVLSYSPEQEVMIKDLLFD